MKRQLHVKVNGTEITREVEEDRMLLGFLREDLHLTGTKEGCGEGDCGACTVLLDGKSVNSCLYPALLAEGKEVTTIEGIEKDGELSEIQKAFIDHGAIRGHRDPPEERLSRAVDQVLYFRIDLSDGMSPGGI